MARWRRLDFIFPPSLALLDLKGDPSIQDAGGHTVLDKLDRNSTKAIADWPEFERGGTRSGPKHTNPGRRRDKDKGKGKAKR